VGRFPRGGSSPLERMQKAPHSGVFSWPEASCRGLGIVFGLLPVTNPNTFPNIRGRPEAVAVKAC
jgi:hypothetical protein